MCAPLAAIAPYLAIASTAYTAYSQYQSGQAAAKAANVTAQNNRAIAEYNAKVKEVDAETERLAAVDAKNRGATTASQIRENARKANARARAVAASKGLIVDTGSNLNILEENAATGELSALTAMNNAEREAYGHKIGETGALADAQNLRFTGDVGVTNARYEGKVAKQAGLLNAGSTLVTGASNFATKYPDFFGQKKPKPK